MGLATPAGALERDRSECSLLTFNTSLELNCAILVDRLAGLRGPEAFTASQVVPVESDKPYLGLQRSDTSGQLWQELNLLTLSQFPPFLSISA
jgi:twitching motility protein PilI